MNSSRGFLILLVVTLVAASAAIASLASDSGVGSAPEGLGEPLLPALSASINDVARVELSSASGELVLERDGNDWQLASWQEFPAKGDSVKELVVSLAEATRLQARTSLTARHHLLDVEQPAGADSEALRVRLSDAAGASLADVVLGSSVRGPPRTQRLNARLADASQTWLIDGARRPASEPAQWVSLQLLARPAEDMAAVELDTQDGAPLRLEREPLPAPETPEGAPADAVSVAPVVPDPASAAWRVANVPADRTLRDTARLDRLADALASLNMQRVALDPEPEQVDERWTARFTTHEGLVIEAAVARSGSEHRLNLSFSAQEGSSAALSGEAQALHVERGAWTYLVSATSAEALRSDWDDVLQPLPEPEPPVEPAPESPPEDDDDG